MKNQPNNIVGALALFTIARIRKSRSKSCDNNSDTRLSLPLQRPTWRLQRRARKNNQTPFSVLQHFYIFRMLLRFRILKTSFNNNVNHIETDKETLTQGKKKQPDSALGAIALFTIAKIWIYLQKSCNNNSGTGFSPPLQRPTWRLKRRERKNN